MNKIALTTLAAVAGVSVSFSGSIASADTDWSGIYAGGYYSTGTGEDVNLGTWVLKDDGTFYGAFAGYRSDFGSYVIGGEVATSLAVDVAEAAAPSWTVDSILDVKLTAGYDLGTVLPYAIIGYSMAEAQGFVPYSVTGTMYGVGADWMITDSIFIGAEYNYRFMEGAINSYTIELESYLVRAGYRF